MEFAKWIDNFCPPLSGERLGFKTKTKSNKIKLSVNVLGGVASSISQDFATCFFHVAFESEDEIHHKLRREWFGPTLDASLEE